MLNKSINQSREDKVRNKQETGGKQDGGSTNLHSGELYKSIPCYMPDDSTVRRISSPSYPLKNSIFQ
jgi:hypothetical protein